MGNVVNLVLVQADGLHQVNLNFVAGCNTANQVSTGDAHVLGNSKDGWNIVAGV